MSRECPGDAPRDTPLSGTLSATLRARSTFETLLPVAGRGGVREPGL